MTKLNEDVVGRDIQPATYNLASTIKRSSFVFGDRLNDTRLMILAVDFNPFEDTFKSLSMEMSRRDSDVNRSCSHFIDSFVFQGKFSSTMSPLTLVDEPLDLGFAGVERARRAGKRAGRA